MSLRNYFPKKHVYRNAPVTLSARLNNVCKHFIVVCADEDEGEYQPASKEVDTSYSDPLGPAPDRPRTSAAHGRGNLDDEFADEEIGDDLLPE